MNGRKAPVVDGRTPTPDFGLIAAHAELSGCSGSIATVCKGLADPTLPPSCRATAWCALVKKPLCSAVGFSRTATFVVETRVPKLIPVRARSCGTKVLLACKLRSCGTKLFEALMYTRGALRLCAASK